MLPRRLKHFNVFLEGRSLLGIAEKSPSPSSPASWRNTAPPA
jgi:phage tail tube protein FII